MQKIHTTRLVSLNALGHLRLGVDFLVPKFGSCGYSLNGPNKSVLRLSKGYSKASCINIKARKKLK